MSGTSSAGSPRTYRAVGPPREPLRVFLPVWISGRALEGDTARCDVERSRALDEAREISSVTKVAVYPCDRLPRAERPWAAGRRPAAASSACSFLCAVAADRVHRRQVRGRRSRELWPRTAGAHLDVAERAVAPGSRRRGGERARTSSISAPAVRSTTMPSSHRRLPRSAVGIALRRFPPGLRRARALDFVGVLRCDRRLPH